MAIVPLVDEEHVCLIRNFRVAVGKTMWEIPAGTLDHDEPPLATAGRELIEETGYRAAEIELLTELAMSPGILNERMYVYLARGLTPGPTAVEPGEEIATSVLAWADALAMIERGEIHDAKTVAGLLFYDRFRDSALAGRGAGRSGRSAENIATRVRQQCQLPVPMPTDCMLVLFCCQTCLVSWPTMAIEPNTTPSISASMTAYSTVVAAVSSRSRRVTRPRIHSCQS